MVIAEHWTAHTRGGWDRVVEPESAEWLWARLRERYPGAFATTLMPDHLHLLPPGRHDPDVLRRILQHHTRRFGARWYLENPQPVNTRRILRRTGRYLVRNADRDGLVAHPFEWPWSSLRDFVGAVEDPWTPLERLAIATRMQPAALLAELVDPYPPQLVSPAQPLAAPLAAIAEAAAAATRTTPDAIERVGATRGVFVGLARDVGGCRLADLADACGVAERTVRRLQQSVPAHAVAAARRCLADPRLQRWCAPQRRMRTAV
jgi:hypothetical protein